MTGEASQPPDPAVLEERTRMWRAERPAGYNQLEWVRSRGLIDPFVELSKGMTANVYVDLGTGTGAVLAALEPQHSSVVGLDISEEMLSQVPRRHEGVRLISADVCQPLPLKDGCVDLVTERMVLHDLADPGKTIREAWRILRPGGEFLAGEYVIDVPSTVALKAMHLYEYGEGPVPLFGKEQYKEPNPEIVGLLRRLFALKHEPDRHLWTGEQFRQLVDANAGGRDKAELHYSVRRHEVGNWLEKSGFPVENCKQVGLMMCLEADPEIKRSWPLEITLDGEIVPIEHHEELLRAYMAKDVADREKLGLDAHFYAAFAYVRIIKDEPKTN